MSSGCERNRVRLVAMLVACVLFSTVFYGCGGGGGSTTVIAPQYGAIEGYVYAPIGSGARIAEATPAGKKAVQGASVTVTCGSTQKNSTTNSSGYFKITSLPTGSCSLTVAYSGFGSYQTNVSITANNTATVGGSNGISLSLATSGSITVTANVSGGSVSIDGENTGVTIPAGLSYVFEGIAPGAHTVSISQAGYDIVAEKNVDVTQGEIAELIFIMNPEGNTAPIANAGPDGKAFVGYRYEWNEASSSYLQKSMDYTLDGSGCWDANSDDLTYKWTQVSGPATTLSSVDTTHAVFSPTSTGAYRFRLTVNDGYLEDSTEVTITAYELSGKLAFYAHPSTSEIFFMNADGTNYYQLTNQSTSDSHPHWSPDGTLIAYSADNGTDTFMALINADGTGQTTTSIPYGALDWFPDGTILAWKYFSGQMDFYRINPDGTGEQRLTNLGINAAAIQVSPDGTKIAFSQDFGGDNYEIMVINSDGSNVQRLTNNSFTDWGLSWMPDGTLIYYTSNYVGDRIRGLYRMNADGTNVTQISIPSGLTNIKSNITASSDGQFLFLTDQNNKLSVMFSDGSNWTSYGITGYNPDYHPGP